MDDRLTGTIPAEVRSGMRPGRRIALLMNMELGCCRNLIRGIHAYALERQGWILRNSPCDPRVIAFLRDWRPDGIIAALFDRKLARHLIRMGRPVVDTAFTIRDLKLPVVDVDHVAVGRLAAEHLRARGYRHFGFLGSKSALYSELRAASYARTLGDSGHSVSTFLVEYLYEDFATSSWKKDEPQIQRWVAQLPKPVAVFACNDIAARGLVDIATQQRLRVPEDVAILGADDDELESLLTCPPLSSVAIPAKRVGYEAAAMLDRIMSGEAPCDRVFLPPARVIVRQSTDTRATDDPVASEALRFVRAHASRNISVTSIARAIGVGRRDLERRFRQLWNVSVLEEIRQVRIERVKQLLAGTDLPISAIARQSGFSSPERMTAVFSQLTGTSPTVFRRQISG